MVPSLTEKITDSFYQTDGYDLVNELAQQLNHMKDNGNILTYKAMMHVACGGITLKEALGLSR